MKIQRRRFGHYARGEISKTYCNFLKLTFIFIWFIILCGCNEYNNRISSKVVPMSGGLMLSAKGCADYNQRGVIVDGCPVYVAPHKEGFLVITSKKNLLRKGFIIQVIEDVLEK